MIHRIPLCSGSIIVLQVYLLEGPVMTHQIHLLLGGPITVPQIFLLRERPITAPRTPLNLEGLWNPWPHQSSGRPVMTPLIRLLMSLIHRTEPNAVTPQKEPPAKLLHIGRGQDPLSPQSRRAASMSVTRTSLRHEKGKPNFIMEINSMTLKALHPAVENFIRVRHLEDVRVTRWALPPTQVTVRKPLIQTFLLHGRNQVQGPRVLIQICHLHEIDLGATALILTSLHQGGNRGPNPLILTCLHLEGLSLWERRLHTCILGLKLGWC